MRILFVASQLYFPQLYGGVQTSTDQLCHALMQRGHHVAVLAGVMPEGWFGTRARIKMLLNRLRYGKKYLCDNDCGYPVWRTWFPSELINYVAAEEKTDLIVIMSGKMMPLVTEAKKTGLPLLVQLHDIAFHAQQGDLHQLAGFPCVANSNFTAQKYKENFGIESSVIYPFIMRDAYRTSTNRQNVTFINPHPRKGLEIALQIAAACPDIPFTFIEGWTLAPDERAALNQKLAKLSNVTFLPSQKDMRAIYSKCKILLVPSICEEAFGRVTSEAQINGIPVIASNRGGLPEAVGSGGLLFDPEDPIDTWINGVRTLWNDDNLYSRLSDAAYKHAEREAMDFTHQIDAHEKALIAASQKRRV